MLKQNQTGALRKPVSGFSHGLLLAVLCFSWQSAKAIVHAQELILSLSLNSEDTHRLVSFVQTTDGSLWIDCRETALWRIRISQKELLEYNNRYYCPLSLKGIKYKINSEKLSIRIDIPPSKLLENHIQGYTFSPVVPQKPALGAFVNYDLNGQSVPGNQQLNALLEAGIFSSRGVLTSTELAQLSGNTHRNIRLSTTWTRDYPETMQTLRLGDTFTNPGMWGQSVGYGGIQWGTNFATQPYFIPFPLP